jgi:hypothetical protein
MIILSIDGPLHFANREYFKANLFKATGINPVALKKQRSDEAKKNPDFSNDTLKEVSPFGRLFLMHVLIHDISLIYLIYSFVSDRGSQKRRHKYLTRKLYFYSKNIIQNCSHF